VGIHAEVVVLHFFLLNVEEKTRTVNDQSNSDSVNDQEHAEAEVPPPVPPPDEGSLPDDEKTPTGEESALARKTELESKLLEQQLSKPFEVREWLKALTGLAAIAALLAAFFQLQQNYYQRAEDRLERAIARLASSNMSERLAGLSTLRIVLDEGPSSQRRIALSALANSVAAESEPIVSGAILDLLKYTDTESQDGVLEELANGSRGLLSLAMKKEPRQAYADWVVDHGDYGRLHNIERAIVGFLHRGARTNDLTGIYCVECNFEGLNLRGVDFSGAVLNNSSFAHSMLARSSFEHAVLLAANFTSADLRHAKFTLEPQNTAFAADSITNGGEMAWGPDFSCANLENADVSRQEFLSFVEEGSSFINPFSFFTAKFSNANLTRTDFRSTGVYGALIPRFKADLSTAAMLKLMRQDFPFPLDYFALDYKPREITFVDLSGTRTVPYLSFRGTLNPSAPIGNDLKRFSNSLNRIVDAFAGSNWHDAQLPNSLRQFLTQADVPTIRTASCTPSGG
jgi:uncharacterized protein YjbI with pentapeptide repeats